MAGVLQTRDLESEEGEEQSPCISSVGPSTGSSLPRSCAPPPGRPATQQPRRRAARMRGGDHAHGDRSPLLRASRAHALLRHPQLLPDVRAGARSPGRQPLHRLAQQFLVEHPHEGYTAVSGAPPQCRATTRKGSACQRTPPAPQRLLPLPPAPRGHRGPRARGGLRTARPSGTTVQSGARPAAWAPGRPRHVGSGDAPGRRRRRHLHRRGARRADGSRPHREGPLDALRAVRGVLEAVRLVLASGGRASPASVERFAHGMTVATNALLEGRTARTALIATEGFTDVIELGRQNRPHLYRLCEAAPAPLVPARAALRRARAHGPGGHAAARSTPDAARALVAGARATPAPEAVAVALLHSYADPAHERLLGALLRRAAARTPHVSLSSELVGTFREYERTATTVLDAALSPAARAPIWRGCHATPRAAGLREPQIMQSSGGLTDAARAGEHAALTVLSGPAGGVGGALLLAGLAGERDVLCFDMGGTSCDVCLIADGAGARDRRAHDRGAAAGAAGARHPHGRRRRRLDRLARSPAARCASGPPRRAPSPGPPATGAAASSRRSPTRTCCSGGCSRTRRSPAGWRSIAAPPSARSAALAARARPGAARVRGRDRARRRGGDARSAARDDRRARHRPARASR